MSHHLARRALLAARPRYDPSAPLQTYQVDDADPFLTFDGAWNSITNYPQWPGGLYQDSMHYCTVVDPSAPLTQLTTGLICFAGTPDEGLFFLAANEDGGPLTLQLQALDVSGLTWHEFSTFGSNSLTYSYASGLVYDAARYYSGYTSQTQSYYSRLGQEMLALVNLPAGRYRFRLVKLVNSNAPSDSGGNKATYFDSLRITSRVPRANW